jgi:Mannosyl-glycoprotein endo-beta-N-acetylglucosaminidase
MRYVRSVRVLACAVACAATLATTTAPAWAGGTHAATVASGGHTLNVRKSSSTAAALLRKVTKGSRVTVVCQQRGQTIHGSLRVSAWWDRLAGGGYVADAYLRWRPSRPKLPVCNAKPGGTTAGAPTPAPTPTPAPSMTHAQFIAAVGPLAQGTARVYKVPASVTLAQAILESGWGNSKLSSVDRNYFGIKCFNAKPGVIAIGCHAYNTSECGNGKCWRTVASFRVYRGMADSIADHGRFLVVNQRYKPAFAFSRAPDKFAAALQAAGYATSPTYATRLVALMQRYKLYAWDI